MQEKDIEGKIGYLADADLSPSDILFMLKELPDACCIFKVLTDPFGTVKDMLFLFANEKYAQLTGYSTAELVGNTFYKTVNNQDEDWIKFSYQAAILRQSSINRSYNSQHDMWLEFWVVPVYQKGFCAYIIHDVTATKKEEDTRAFQTKTSNLVIECAKAASTSDFAKGTKRVLRILGQTLEADRVYVVRTEGNKLIDRYEWISKSGSSDLPSKKVFEKYDLVDKWNRQLKGKDFSCVNDTSLLADLVPDIYNEYLAGRCARFAISVLRNKDERLGFLVADNYALDLQVDISEVMETVSIFLSSQITNHELNQELRFLGGHDALTGLGNRYSLSQELGLLREMSVSVGVCYTDINGLKAINDEKGHEAGDKLITDTAALFGAIFKKKFCYRFGGDEFIAVVPEIDREKFSELVEKFRTKAKGVAIAVGWEWSDNSSDVNKLIKKADDEMYKDKARYYKSHERRHANNT
ncbi:diguanylate cyclase [Butyrivibrio sp. CB08]|uniref:sensor domain-containing diguanylate cyclase n=1 Tax=Butyrivibrio sp. CB08 TaxID=2364879 RepID=UPI000EA8A59E|nr:diguanylate cyclase [Butyrivibrio sp. CB08]RKM59256.1 diguanylate cyclase [Butyrivibrio sp. CB08]